jgi:chromosome segregation ATPase
MNLKRWFAWLCLALALVTEILLFRANHEKDAASTGLREAQQENRQLSGELAELKNSNAGLQAAEISRLRKQNEILTNKLATLQAVDDQLRAESQQNAQHLTTARTALQLQQEHLAQLQTENEQIAAVQAETIQRNTCINNLRQIDAAKQQWALEKNKTTDAVPTAQDLLPYLKDGVFPVCPDGGTYTINAVGELPSCSITGHDLPAP